MSHKLKTKSAGKVHELIGLLAIYQIEMEKGHFDTLRAILRYAKAKYPEELEIKYPTAQAWLNQERHKILFKK